MKKLLIPMLLLATSCCIMQDICDTVDTPELDPDYSYGIVFEDTVYYAKDNFIDLLFEYRGWCVENPIVQCYEGGLSEGNIMYTVLIKQCDTIPRYPDMNGFIEWYIEFKRR